MSKRKKINKKDLVFPIVMTVILLLLLVLLFFKIIIFSKPTPTINFKKENNTNETVEEIDLSKYAGSWYQSENDSNSSYIRIKSTSKNSVILNLVISKEYTMQDTNVDIIGTTGQFESTTEDDQLKITGTINLENDKIIIKITNSEVPDVEKGFINFAYKS